MPIETVLGPVGPADLGQLLIHEHILAGLSGATLDYRWRMDRSTVIEQACARLADVKPYGLRTLVDATPIEMGRDPRLLAEVSERSGVQIICATGFYASDYGFPTHFRQMSVEDLAALYIAELTEGIDGSGIRSGVIKIATSGDEPTESEMKILEVAAIAQRHSGVPIITHTTGGGGDRQAAILIDHGVPPQSLVIGHVDHKNSSYRYLHRILRSGAAIAFDRVGSASFLPDAVRAGLLVALLREGFGDRLLISMDAAAAWTGPTYATAHDAPPAYLHLFASFLPLLRSMGVTDETLDQLLIDNPRAIFQHADCGDGDVSG